MTRLIHCGPRIDFLYATGTIGLGHEKSRDPIFTTVEMPRAVFGDLFGEGFDDTYLLQQQIIQLHALLSLDYQDQWSREARKKVLMPWIL